MFSWNNVKGKSLVIAIIVLVCSLLLATFAYRTATTVKVIPTPKATTVKKPFPTPTLPPTMAPTPTATPLPLGPIHGVESDLKIAYTGIPWVRFGYRTCGVKQLSGDALRAAIRSEEHTSEL